MMNDLVAAFPNHLEEALKIGESASLSPASKAIHNVVVTGLGGSGIGGTIVSQLIAEEASVPIAVNKDYTLPGYVGENTLVIVSSYSGNTEETLDAMKAACDNGAEVCCITTNGEVLKTAKEHDLNHIVVTPGMPPRAAFGYSFTQLFFVLNHYGIIGNSFKAQLKAAKNLLESEGESIRSTAKELASKLEGKLPIIYSGSEMEGVCIRFRQQLNENAKMLAWHHVFPELNHNELVGWRKENQQLAIVVFQSNLTHKRTAKRIQISKEIFQKYTNTIIDVEAKGASVIEQALYLIHLGDWASCYLAEANNMDAMEIEVIDYLKSELAKF